MSKHQFRLQKVLKAKEIKKKVEQRKLAERQQDLETEELELKELKQTEQEFLSKLRQKRLKPTRGHEIRNDSAYQRQVQKYVEQQDKKVASAQQEVEEQRETLIDATQETEMLDKLKEQDYQKYLQRVNKHEQKRVDELSQFEPFRKDRDE
ncbi:MAG: flagellar export protein FliJ [Candidatus Marinimicrobia bacterium]|nr:flagellar export protein FliJ [Candidatus Neomarinimicrobiota bacterium]MCF7880501.1 flagellar export protein FliJ [Candidatus Neomarinimicrobiota bacterium]